MFGHKAMMFRGCYESTGDLTNNGGVTGDFAASQTNDDTGTDDNAGDDTGGETEVDDDSASADDATQQKDDDERTSKQPPEVDAAFAKLRREAEEAKRQLQQRDRWVADQFGKTHGIYTWEQYQQAVQQQQQQQQVQVYNQARQELADQGYDVDAISRIMEMNPAFQNMRQQNEILQRQLQEQQLNQRLLAEYGELQKEYPDMVKKPDDISNDVWAKFDQGYSLLDAFESINRQALKKRAADAAKQKTLNNLGSKSHLKTEGDGSSESNDVHVPSDTLQMYMDMGMSKKQAAAYHKKLYG